MNKKSKIILILQILMILFFVPAVVISIADENTEYQSFSDKEYNKDEILNSIKSSNPEEYKKWPNYKRIFSLDKKNQLSPSNYSEAQYIDKNSGEKIVEILEKDAIIGNTGSLDSSLTFFYDGSSIPGYPLYFKKYYSKKLKASVNDSLGNTIALPSTVDLSKVPIFDGKIIKEYFNMKYAASFSDTKKEIGQQSIWGYTNDETKNSLYYANETYNEYENILIEKNQMDNDPVISLADKYNTGSFLSEDEEYIYIGPFSIGDYIGVEAKDYIDEFSGKDLVQPNVLAGLVEGSITIDRYESYFDKIGVTGERPETDKEVDRLQLTEEEEGYIGKLKFGELYEEKEICIFYGNGGAGWGNAGTVDEIKSDYIKPIPDTIKLREDNTSILPRPKSTFYVRLPAELLKDPTSTVSGLDFSYRKTESTGSGDYVIVNNVIEKADGWGEAVFTNGNEETDGWAPKATWYDQKLRTIQEAYICECGSAWWKFYDSDSKEQWVLYSGGGSFYTYNKKENVIDKHKKNCSNSGEKIMKNKMFHTSGANGTFHAQSYDAAILLIKDAKTVVKKTNIDLWMDMLLATEMTVETHIDKVTSIDGIEKYGTEIEYYDSENLTDYGYVEDEKSLTNYGYFDDGDKEENCILQTTTGDNRRREVQDIFDTIRPTSISSSGEPISGTVEEKDEKWTDSDGVNIENWKKENPVILENGDTIEYLVEVKNYNINQVMNCGFDVYLPMAIDNEITIQAVYEVYENGAWQIRDNALNIKKINTSTLGDPYWGHYVLKASHFPQDEQVKKEQVNTLRVPVYSRKLFRITVKVNTQNGTPNAGDAYQIAAKIHDIRRFTGYHNIINLMGTKYSRSGDNSARIEDENIASRDYFKVKEYNVSVNKYISDLRRADDSKIPNEEYSISNVYQDHWDRAKFDDSTKATECTYVENGDIVTYLIKLTNEANEQTPYYNPKPVKVTLEDTLPTPTARVINIIMDGKECEWVKVAGEQTIKIHNIVIKSGETKTITVRVRNNSEFEQPYEFETLMESRVTIEDIANINGKLTSKNEIVNHSTKITSADYFRIKEYNVVIDKFISDVSHAESRGGTQTTYNSDERVSEIGEQNGVGSNDKIKENKPVFVEYGDRISYIIKVYNTTRDKCYNVKRQDDPYRTPKNIYVDITEILPEKFSDLQILGAEGILEGNKVKMQSVPVDENSVKEIAISFIVEEQSRDSIHIATSEITKVTNINKYLVINNGKRLSSSDRYKLNDYDVTLEEYVSAYHAEMAKYNNRHGFTDGEDEGFVNGSEDKNSYPIDNPLKLEKYETLMFETKVTNNASGGESENNSTSYEKYNTRVRPTEVTQIVDYGLVAPDTREKEFKAIWYNADGTIKLDLTNAMQITAKENPTKKQRTYTYTVNNDYMENGVVTNIILSPGEYIIYYLTVEVVESNMYLGQLKSESKVKCLTNVNRNINSIIKEPLNGATKNATCTRVVTSQNISNKTIDADYMRLKELVIAGTVWIDKNKDGYNNDNIDVPKLMNVKLYRVNGQDSTLVAEKGINDNGLYTFGRQKRADDNENYYQYYIEFEYDGITYKATDVYGGDADGLADGMQNLDGAAGSYYWRQGYSDLPGRVNNDSKEEYLHDSNAYEFDDVRNSFNSKYGTIGYNQSYQGETENIGLKYYKNGHTSILTGDSENSLIMTARSFITQNHKLHGQGVTQSLTNTKTLFLNETTDGMKYKGHYDSYPETEYLKFINLGLVIREQVDLSIDADIQSVKTTINGEEMTYDFNTNKADSTGPEYSNQPNAYKLDQSYNLNLYSSDFNYRSEELYKREETELSVEVNYKVRITNNKVEGTEAPIEAAINEIAIYYDKNFMTPDKKIIVKVKDPGCGVRLDKTVKAVTAKSGERDIQDSINVENSKYSKNKEFIETNKDKITSGYNILYLSLDDTYLKQGESKEIELTFIVDKTEDRTLKIEDELEIIAEIGAYTTRYGDDYKHSSLAGKIAGLVDKDSNPGNILVGNENIILNNIENYDTYEDDTYKTGIKLGVGGNRTISGTVWDDTRSEVVGTEETGIQYIGNGQYDSDEIQVDKANLNPNVEGNRDKPIQGVKVSLIELVQIIDVKRGKKQGDGTYVEYPVKDRDGNLITAITDENGNYTLKGFVPGYYVVRFDYGYDSENKNTLIYNGQDYKSTTYYNEGYYEDGMRYGGDDIGSVANFTYFDNVKAALGKTKKSDALDDEIRRLEVNSYSETITTAQAKAFNNITANEYKYKEALTQNTHMYADSTIFYVKPEEQKSADTSINATVENFNENRLWTLQNLDFGLQYRPENTIKLEKNVSLIELITSSGKTLAKLVFDKDDDGNKYINSTKSVGEKNVMFIPSTNGEQGLIYINMDTDILTGCTVNVEYDITVDNNSEVDRISKNLYDIRYEKGAIDKDYKEKVYVSNRYNANATAAQFLKTQYYKIGKKATYNEETGAIEGLFAWGITSTPAAGINRPIIEYHFGCLWYSDQDYLLKLKKPYTSEGTTRIYGTQTAEGQGYYGMYLGETYYTGKIAADIEEPNAVGKNDVVAELKIDHILEYVDNSMTFSLKENTGKDKLWKIVSVDELFSVVESAEKSMLSIKKEDLVDNNGVSYASRNNLLISVDDNNRGQYEAEGDRTIGNASLSRFLKTSKVTNNKDETQGKIAIGTSKILSVEDISEKKDALKYESIAEVVQFTTLTGRRTTLPNNFGTGNIVGNKNPSGGGDDADSDIAEIITITPPTGLPQNK